jgi:hypothetical protein
MISDILEKEAELPSLEILRKVQKAGYSGGESALYALVASLRPMQLATRWKSEGLSVPWFVRFSISLKGQRAVTGNDIGRDPRSRSSPRE